MRSYTVTSVWGIPIRVNVSLLVFLPILAWLIGSGEQIAVYVDLVNGLFGRSLDAAVLGAGTTPWLIGVAAAVGLFVSVTLHELGHSWVALRYGLDVESITLWILGGIASLGTIPKEWTKEFWIAIAGPITSVLVAGACAAALGVIPDSAPVLLFVFGWLAVTNVVLAIFNLLPAFPMDGGRIFRALLARNRSYASATRLAARVGVIFAILFAVFGVLSFSPLLLLLALFIYGAATSESRVVMLDELLSGWTVADIAGPDVPEVDHAESVDDFLDRMMAERETVYEVVEAGDVVGLVTLGDLQGVAHGDRATTAVESVMTDADTLARVDSSVGAFDGLLAMDESGGDALLLTTDGRVTGMVTREDYMAALELRQSVGVLPPARTPM